MHSLSIAKVRVHLAVDEQQIQHGFSKRGGRGRREEEGEEGGEKMMGERGGRKEKRNVLRAHTSYPSLSPFPSLPSPFPILTGYVSV